MPTGLMRFFAVYENKNFMGSIIFGNGACRTLGNQFGLQQNQVFELTRVALAKTHTTPISRVIKIALAILKKTDPGVILFISYADAKAGHLGKIYQAMNWIYLGESFTSLIFAEGRLTHTRNVGERLEKIRHRYPLQMSSIELVRKFIDPGAEVVRLPAKFKYAHSHDKNILGLLRHKSLAYPKVLPCLKWDSRRLQSGRRLPQRKNYRGNHVF